MGTITARKRKDNSTAYAAQIRINRDGKTVYQESRTFDCKQVAQAWAKRRETELAQADELGHAAPNSQSWWSTRSPRLFSRISIWVFGRSFG
jgi:hypothetical protein